MLAENYLLNRGLKHQIIKTAKIKNREEEQLKILREK